MLSYSNLKTRKKGFTLLEVIIAIFLLTVGITGAFWAIHQNMKSIAVYPSKTIAAYLTQEGIEIVRNIRDTNWVEGVAWNSDLCATPPCEWEADYTTSSFTTDCGNPAHKNCESYSIIDELKIDTNGFYNYSAGTDTKFYRSITISPVDGYALKVSVETWWSEEYKKESVIAQEILYNWK